MSARPACGATAKSSGSMPSVSGDRAEHDGGQPELGPHQRPHVDLAEGGLLVDLSFDLDMRSRGVRRARAGDPLPRSRRARGPAGRACSRGAARPGAPYQQVSQLAGVPPADDQVYAVDDDRAVAAVLTELAHVRERDEALPMDADEAGVAPAFLEGGDRDAHQVALVGGVQPDVVALGLDVPDLAALDEPGDAASSTGIVSSSSVAGGCAAVDDPADCLADAAFAAPA